MGSTVTEFVFGALLSHLYTTALDKRLWRSMSTSFSLSLSLCFSSRTSSSFLPPPLHSIFAIIFFSLPRAILFLISFLCFFYGCVSFLLRPTPVMFSPSLFLFFNIYFPPPHPQTRLLPLYMVFKRGSFLSFLAVGRSCLHVAECTFITFPAIGHAVNKELIRH